MRKYYGVDNWGKEFEMEVGEIFDESLPDVIEREPEIEWRVGSNGEMFEHHQGFYDPSANHYKVVEHIWNHFNDRGKGSINHAFGGYDHEVLYQFWADKMTLKEWKELKMWMLTQSLWYWDAFTNPIESQP